MGQLIAAGIEGIFQDGHRHIAHVLVVQSTEDTKHSVRIVGVFGDEPKNGAPIASRLNKEISSGGTELLCFLGIYKGGLVCLANGIFLGKTGLVGSSHLGADLGHHGLLNRGHNVERLIGGAALEHIAVSECDIHHAVLTESHLTIAIPPVLAGPHEHIAHAGSERRFSVVVGILGGSRIKLAVIVDAEFHLGALDGVALLVEHLHPGGGGSGIVADEVDLGEIAGTRHHFLGSVVVTEGACVHQQRT